MSGNGTPDTIGQAIEAAAQPPAQQRISAKVEMLDNPARVAVLDVPTDISDLELLSLVNGVVVLGDQLRAMRAQQARPQLVAFRGTLPPAPEGRRT